MNVLLIGGTGLISTGIVKHLQKRGASISMFNRGKRTNRLEGDVTAIIGDRNNPAELEQCVAGGKTWDVVIDMVCFNQEPAEATVKIFAGKCKQFIFCSTVCTYGVKIPPGVIVDESFPQEPISGYGKNKVLCEKVFEAAAAKKAFELTIIRPSHTYGEGNPLIDNIEFDSVAWDRIEKGIPVLCSGDGLGLWNSTHRDDVGKLFAYASLNPKTYGQNYNATTERVFTWRDYYREAAAALGKKAKVIFAPADFIVAQDPKRFGLLAEITQFHGPYSSKKARRDVPEFTCDIDFQTGAKRVFNDIKNRNKWKQGSDDAVYQSIVDKMLAAGLQAVEL